MAGTARAAASSRRPFPGPGRRARSGRCRRSARRQHGLPARGADRIGGFDVALGAGTPTGGGEDTLAITLVLLCGYEVAYEPVRAHVASPPSGHGQPQRAAARVQHRADRLLRRPAEAAPGRAARPAQVAAHGGRLPERRRSAAEGVPWNPPDLAAELDRGQLQGMLKGRWSTPGAAACSGASRPRSGVPTYDRKVS